MPAKAARRARDRGMVRQRGNSFQVIVYAGVDPVTGKDSYLSESTLKEKDVERIRTRLLAEVDRQRSVSTKANLGYILDAWLAVHEVDPSTLLSYRRTVEKRIKPALGQVAAAKITPRRLEEFYAELRRCRERCDGRPFVEHRTSSPHECDGADRSTRRTCRPHVCRPYAPATIRETHVIISGALSAAVRWGWLTSNPADNTKKPRVPKPQPDPPSPADAARIAEAAWGQDEDWGMLVWLVLMTGVRRGEILALRWPYIDFGAGVAEIRRSYVDGIEKQTKTHQIRRIALDEPTLRLLAEHKSRYVRRSAQLGIEPRVDAFVFSYAADGSRPRDPDGVSHRYAAMCQQLGISSHLHALRHYSATELLSAGVDIRTVAGRLGHGSGGATTLRVYAAWVAESDRRAAGILGSQFTPPAASSEPAAPGGSGS